MRRSERLGSSVVVALDDGGPLLGNGTAVPGDDASDGVGSAALDDEISALDVNRDDGDGAVGDGDGDGAVGDDGAAVAAVAAAADVVVVADDGVVAAVGGFCVVLGVAMRVLSAARSERQSEQRCRAGRTNQARRFHVDVGVGAFVGVKHLARDQRFK